MSTEIESERAEIERLRAQITALEARLIETEAWANRVVAEAQEKTYWLDRWQLDLGALMERRGAAELRAALRAVRAVIRLLRRLWQRRPS